MGGGKMAGDETPDSPCSLLSLPGLNMLSTSYLKKLWFPFLSILSIPPTILLNNCAEFDPPSLAASFTSCNGDEACDVSYDSVSSPFLVQKRRSMDYGKLMRYYQEDLEHEEQHLKIQKYLLKNYTPGSFIEEVGGLRKEDYMIPEMTALLLLGPSGSGKSCLVNKITRVVEDGEFLPDRAQETYDSSLGEGTCFLQEYKVPRRKETSFCLYDTRSISDAADSFDMVNGWIMNGVQHGQMVLRGSDDERVRTSLQLKARQGLDCANSKKRVVHFVIFVVDAISVLKSMQGEDHGQYTKLIEETFRLPCLSFKDAKPAVVITHGDVLSISNRAHVRLCLGKLLGVPPEKQIFDIPDSHDPKTKLAIMNLLIYSLQQADRSLHLKQNCSPNLNMTTNTESIKPSWSKWSLWLLHAFLTLLLVLIIGCNFWVMISTSNRQAQNETPKTFANLAVEEPMIRKLWKSIEQITSITLGFIPEIIAQSFRKIEPLEEIVRWRDIRHLWLDV